MTAKYKKTPPLKLHKASGQGYVRIDSRVLYFGKYELSATRQKYHRFIAEWLADGCQMPLASDGATVTELCARFWQHAQRYYVRADGTPTGEADNFKTPLRLMKRYYGDTLAAEFSPKVLKTLRQKLIDKGLCRTTINSMVGRIRRVFRWAAEQEFVPSNVYHGLQTVPGLKYGRSNAYESEPTKPVPQESIDAIEPHVSKQVWAVIQLQILTAARPGELLMMRPCDIDRTGKIWVYAPAQHKTAHHGHSRKIYLGPRAQRLLNPFLLRPPLSCCFSPAEAEAERLTGLHQNRKTPLSCGNKPGSNRRQTPRKSAGRIYTPNTYARAIVRACDHAFPPPYPLAKRKDETERQWQSRLTKKEKVQLKAWEKEHRWHPHQLRHNAATYLRKEFGLETARIILGHRSAVVTEIYAEIDEQKAIETMLKIG